MRAEAVSGGDAVGAVARAIKVFEHVCSIGASADVNGREDGLRLFGYSQSMGRARAREIEVFDGVDGVDGFGRVFGTRRGVSPEVHAQRDARERGKLELYRKQEQRRDWDQWIQAVLDDCGATGAANTLMRAWRLPEDESVQNQLYPYLRVANIDYSEELPCIVKRGDPRTCPGLTAPALKVLIECLHTPEDADTDTRAQARQSAYTITDVFFGRIKALGANQRAKPPTAEEWIRIAELQELWTGLADFVERLPSRSKHSQPPTNNDVCVRLAQELTQMPTTLLTGALAPANTQIAFSSGTP